jgi:hypothetical protein
LPEDRAGATICYATSVQRSIWEKLIVRREKSNRGLP